MQVSIEELRQHLEYDPETGAIHWLKGHRGPHHRACRRIAGSIKNQGYREIEFDVGNGRFFLRAHRVAWALAAGAWPENEIDHRDGDRGNNRLANLREATRAENAQNLAPRPRKGAPMVGASRTPEGRWRACMYKRHLGVFGSPEEAHQAYLAAKAEQHAFQPQLRGG